MLARRNLTTTPAADAERLVRAAQSGDDRAFGELVAAHLPLLYNIAGRALSGHVDVDDVVQETLLRVVRDLPALRDPGSFRPWLVAIAIRQISTYRHRQRRSDGVLTTAELYEMAQSGSDVQDVALVHLNLSGQRRQVVEAGRWLDPDHRVLLSLWWQETAGRLTRVEVAGAIGLTVAHTGVRLQRMREQLEVSRSIAAALAARPRCAQLQADITGWDGRRTPLWRKRIGRHVRGCPACRRPAAGLIPLERLLLSFTALPVPAGLTAMLAAKGVLPGVATAVGSPAMGAVPSSFIGKLAQAVSAHPLAALATGAVIVGGPAVTYATLPDPVPRPPGLVITSAPPSPIASAVIASPSAKPPARSSPSGGGMALGAWSLAAVGVPNQYLSASATVYAAISPVTESSGSSTRQRATFTVVRGLADARCFSFRAADGRYLRHYMMRLRFSTDDGTVLFREDATFCIQPGSVDGSVVLQSHNYPAHVLRRRDGGIYIEVPDGTQAFAEDSSFLRRTAWAR